MTTIQPAACIGMPLEQVDTPCLLLDLNVFERNLRRLRDSVIGTGVLVRPHAKSHKCPQIAFHQLAEGAVGLCCQKVSEAEAMVAGGVRDVLISNEVVGRTKLVRLAALAKQAKVAVCADDEGNVREIDAAAGEFGAIVDVLIEVNVGANRCGVEPGGPVLKLAHAIRKCPNLRFAGLQAFHGPGQHLRRVDERKSAINSAIEKVRATRELLAQHGIRCEKVTGAGTGTYLFEACSQAYDEVQPGSYVFMDADYAQNDWADSGIPQFEQSLFVWTTVMSRPSKTRVVVDAGLKASSVDSGMPRVADVEGATYIKASDEHGIIELNHGTLSLGEKIKLIPGHCDPTVNLYDYYVCIRDNRVEALWPITARGALL